jgi:hypothetical protein
MKNDEWKMENGKCSCPYGYRTFAASSAGVSFCGATPTPCLYANSPPSHPEIAIKITPNSESRNGMVNR